jgi:hypothetical protein
MDTQKLIDDVNESMFPFQIAVARRIEETIREHGWRVAYKEVGAIDHGLVRRDVVWESRTSLNVSFLANFDLGQRSLS